MNVQIGHYLAGFDGEKCKNRLVKAFQHPFNGLVNLVQDFIKENKRHENREKREEQQVTTCILNILTSLKPPFLMSRSVNTVFRTEFRF